MAKLISSGTFATKGEEDAAELLRRLPEGWVVIANKTVVAGTDRSYEVDFIVVGDNWIYVLDEKSWWGKISGNKQNWVLSSGEVRDNPLNKAEYIGKILAGELKAGVPELREARKFCRGAVLLSLSEHAPELDDPRAADGVFVRNNVLKRLPAVDVAGGSLLIGQHRAQIEHVLTGLRDREATPLLIGGYEIVDALPERPGCRIYRANIGAVQRMLTVYDLGKDPIASRELREFYLREFSALNQLQNSGVVPQVYDPFPWSDNFLVLPVATVQGRPLRAYLPPETTESFINELRVAEAAFGALARVHAAKIVHRTLGPDTVYVLPDAAAPRVMLTNFYAARTDATSIAASLDALAIEDPYAAPELQGGYAFASLATDCYSLAMVFLERFSRTLIADRVPAPGYQVVFPDLDAAWPDLPAGIAADLGRVLRSVIERQVDAAGAAAALGDLARRARGEAQPGQPRLLDGRYKVIRLLGQGSTARTYLARDEEFGGIFALKQYLWPSAVRAHAGGEFDVLRRLSSPYLPRIYDVFPPQNDVHLKMDYVEGPTLHDVRQEFPWPLERWWEFAQDMLNAVQVLEERRLLHRDIKPANIVLREDNGRPVLIDFGFAVRMGVEAQVAGAPLYLPPEAVTSTEPPPSTDRYALATVLFQALTGLLPSALGAASLADAAVRHKGLQDERVQRVADVLLRAAAADPTLRPANIEELRAALQNALLTAPGPGGPDKVNPWVDLVRGLYRNSDVGNANNRGLDTPFVRSTYVPTALDTKLLPQLLSRFPKAVFLSGNPGDGKTAFLEKVRAELEEQGAEPLQEDESGWEWRYRGHILRSCYDASEAFGQQSADEQLTARLSGLEGYDEPENNLTVLVAINDGRLADYFTRNRERFGWLAEQIEAGQSEDDPLFSDVWVVDLKRRSFVSLDQNGAPSFFRRVLETLTDEKEWEKCSGCGAEPICPMRNNARMMAKDAVAQRLQHLLLLSHLRRQRHTTIRDLRSALAYIITGNTSCRQVHAARSGQDASISLVDRYYWRSAFAPLEAGDEVLSDLASLDPARFPQPRLDRFLYFHRSATDAPLRSRLFQDSTDLSPQQFGDEGSWIAAAKRRLYFEASDSVPELDGVALGGHGLPASLLPYQYAFAFVDVLAGRADAEAARQKLAEGILRSDGVTGLEMRGQLAVVVTNSRQQQLTILKQFPLEDLHLKVLRPRGAGLVETIPDLLVLEHASGTPRLEITLDLFELLMRMADGLQPNSPEFQPLLEDLMPLKSALLLRETRHLVLVENGRRVHRISQRDGKIVREAAATEATHEN